tara:strand:+ start:369 stop:527 length:159 start_codon:yes stop_codon:yes gene_type:complete
MAKMKIIREVTKAIFEKAKASEMKDDFEFKMLDKQFYLIAEKRDWVIFENLN